MSERRVVVITGASSGIGEASARLPAQNGFQVFGGARDVNRAPAIPGVRFGTVDVTDETSVSSFVEWVLSEAGRIDVLVVAACQHNGSYSQTSAFSARII